MSDPFDLEHFQALPRLSGLRLSPDGQRLVVAVAQLSADRQKLRTALWQVQVDGHAAPRRLTRSAAGESQGEFLPDGSLLFTSARPDPEAKDGDEPVSALWHLPAGGGEARLLLAPAGGIDGLAVARTSGTVAILASLHPGAADFAADGEREKARKDAGVQARLYESYPIRYWDHYLGPRSARFFLADAPADATDGSDAPLGEVTDLTGPTLAALPEPEYAIADDGSALATTWRRSKVGDSGDDIVIIDRATRERRVLTGGTGWSGSPAFSPDGRLAYVRGSAASPDRPLRQQLMVVDLETGNERQVARDLDRWPMAPQFTPDGGAIIFTADDEGSASIFRVELDGDAVTRLATGGAFTDVCISPDGQTLHALRSHADRPPHLVRLAAAGEDQTPVEVPWPGLTEDALPRRGILERVTAQADDGVPIGSWLLRPADADPTSPRPLVVFVHGGPLGTWAGWSWRWNANLLVERGYAVLMPDPAISVGYGQAFIDRGWGRWGDRPYTDVMAAVDGAVERPDIDGERTALMGGSFGGYMANWVAGHTERFRAIVTHASLWELRGFHGTTDDGIEWEQEFGDPYTDPSRYLEHSPSAHVGNIRTPMLVIHGELDARVPISEGLQLWTDLVRHAVTASFLYFPDENHWILKPQNARLWYETVFAFLDQHVLGKDWHRPELL